MAEEHLPEVPVAQIGRIEWGHIFIELARPTLAADIAFVCLKLIFEDGSVFHEVPLTSDMRNPAFKIVLPTEPQFLKSVCVFARLSGNVLQEFGYGTDYELHDLLPETDGERLPSSFVRKDRIKHAGTLRFMAQQILQHCSYNLFVKIEVVKILSYIAVEENEQDGLSWVVGLLDEYYPRAVEFKGTKGSSKNNRIHVECSLLFVRLLVLLSSDEYDRVQEDWSTFYELRTEVSTAPIIAFNMALSLAMYGWALARGGKTAEATTIFAAIIMIFRAAAAAMPASKAKSFAELNASFQAAIFAVECLTEIRGGRTDWSGDRLGAVAIVTRFSRLSGREANQRIGEKLEAFAAQLARVGEETA